MNFTDVEDKALQEAAKRKMSVAALTEKIQIVSGQGLCKDLGLIREEIARSY